MSIVLRKRLSKIYHNIFSSPSISRLTLDKILIPELRKLNPEITIDIGAKHSPYRKYIKTEYYFNTDIEFNENLSFVSSITSLPLRKESVDFILCTEVLEHINQPQLAVDNIFEALNEGGTCILTTRFMFPYHGDPEDYFRYTHRGLEFLFKKYREVRLISHGNKFQLILYILSKNKLIRPFLIPVNLLAAQIKTNKTRFAFGYLVVAKK